MKMRTRRLFLPIATIALAAGGVIAPPTTAAAEDQYFYIVNQSTDMAAEVFAHSQAENARVVLWPNYGGESQQFRQQFTTDGWFLLVAKHSGKCLSGSNADSRSGPVVQRTCNGELSQQWRTRTVSKTPDECGDPNRCFGGSRTVLDNKHFRYRCLDAANAQAPTPPVQGAALQTWLCVHKFSAWNQVNQNWELVRTQDWPPPAPKVR
ncbi:RICIN domain-containing protein [Streptomyces lavendofoliae]|uniref:RICIN domain-containing protein n=1 Tax=Streptomyces lavendofoliae TaxID=67314 RepID=UPI003D8EAB1E